VINILKFLKNYKLLAALVLVLLILQSVCDLALPTYTRDILNIGLQQNGISDAAAKTIRASELDILMMLMTDGEKQLVDSSYGAEENGLRCLSDNADIKAVSEAMTAPECIVYALRNYSADELGINHPSEVISALESGEVSPDVDSVRLLIGRNTDSYREQLVAMYVENEYAADGVDTNDIRTSYLWSVGFKMILVSIVMLGLSVLSSLTASKISAGVGRELREQIFEKVTAFSAAEMEKFSAASLITRSTNDIAQIQTVSVLLLSFVIYAPILAIGGIIMVIKSGAGMGIIVVDAVLVLVDAIVYLAIIVMPKFKIMQKLVDKVNLVSREILSGIMPIRAFSRERHEEQRFDAANRELMETQLFTGRAMAFLSPVIMFVMNGVSVLIVWIGSKNVDLGVMQVGDITAYITYTTVIVEGFLMLAMVSIILPRAAVAADRIKEVLDADLTLNDPEAPADDRLSDAKGEINFDRVSFTYPGAELPSLEDISFSASPGTTTAIIGATGSGKSTLLDLILRFYDVTSGSIKIDGIDIRDISQSKLHSLIGYVPQKGQLFSGNIESNLKYAGDVSEEEMKLAVDIAQAGFIEELEGGYEYSVAQGGSNVSGGQRQRISIARAIAKKPPILLFDDSFSALDYKTDLALRKALKANSGDACVLIVAQRISTILHADKIIVLENGKTVGVGTHESLMRNCPTYIEIAGSQLSEEELIKEGGDING